ncbi:hypothetical protein D9M70_357010 [compost metagenome]
MILASQRLRSAWAMRITVTSMSRYRLRLGLVLGVMSWMSSSTLLARSTPLVWKWRDR